MACPVHLDDCSCFVLNADMPRWPEKIAAAVTFDVAFALDFKVGRTLRPLTDLERRVVAKTIVDYLQLSNWVIERGSPGRTYITGEPAQAAGLGIPAPFHNPGPF